MFGFLKRNHEERAAGPYTDALVELARGNVTGGTALATETAAVEAAIGLLGRCFSVASIQPAIPALTPEFMASLVRTLLLTGNFLAMVDVDSGGIIRLQRAASWDVLGDPLPESWRYRLDLSGPSRTITRHVPFNGVVHVRMNCSTFTPWRGTSPLQNAGVSGELLGKLESSLRDESRARSGSLLPVPGGLQDSVLATLSADLAAMKGHVALVETTSDGAGSGRANSPQTDWMPPAFWADLWPIQCRASAEHRGRHLLMFGSAANPIQWWRWWRNAGELQAVACQWDSAACQHHHGRAERKAGSEGYGQL